MYQRSAASVNAAMCSTGSLFPSKADRCGSLKFSGTGALQISEESGLGSGSSRSPW